MLLYFGRNNNNPNSSVLSPMKAIPISGKAPPYSFKIVFPKATYKNKLTSKPKIIYPVGFRYFELDIKIKYNHSKPPKTVKTKKSESIPNVKILIVSKPENEA